MVSDRTLWACASKMIEVHGEKAWLQAACRAQVALCKGEVEGYRTFVRILDRVRRLQGLAPGGRLH